jgi:hypothetical protein
MRLTAYAVKRIFNQDRTPRHPLRVFYAFDPLRRAVLLLGGDKTGDDRFYETFVPHAERIWTEYLDDLEEKEKGR